MKSKISRSIMVLLLIIYVSDTQFTLKGHGNPVYVSRTGKDSQQCGAQAISCKTLSMAVQQSKDWGGLIYVDGRSTETDPYTCLNVTSQHPGIYINKSISLIGFQAPVYIECKKGMSLTFESPQQYKIQTVIKIRNILFMKSSLNFVDCSVEIDSCSFIGAAQPISVTQNLRSVNLSINNCGCVNTSACFGVEQKAQNPLGNHVEIEIANSKISGMQSEYIPALTAIGAALFVTSSASHYAKELITTVVNLRNVTFTDSQFSGPYGLLYFRIPIGLAKVTLDDVTVTRMYAQGNRQPQFNSIVKLSGLNQVNLAVNNSGFFDNQNARCFSLETQGGAEVVIANSKFIDNHSYGHGAVLYLSTPTTVTLDTISTVFTRNTADSIGGCFYVMAHTLTINIQGSVFSSSKAIQGDSGALSFSATNLLKVTVDSSIFNGSSSSGSGAGVMSCHGNKNMLMVRNSTFLRSNSRGPGGVISCYGDAVNVTLQNSVFINSFSGGPGGVFSSGFIGKTSRTLSIVLEGVRVEHSTAGGPGGMIGFVVSNNATVVIRDSLIVNSKSIAPGGAIGVTMSGQDKGDASWQTGLVFDISNTTFRNCNTSAIGGTIDAEGTTRFTCSNVHVQSSVARGGPGGAFYITPHKNLNLNINNSSFKYCSAPNSVGGAIHIQATKEQNSKVSIANSVFHSNKAISPGGALCMILQKAKVDLTNTCFSGNEGYTGGAVSLQMNDHSNISFISCTFRNNYSPLVPGGAVIITASRDKLINPGCIPKPNDVIRFREWKYGTVTTITNSTFEGNIAQTGGAIFLYKGRTIIRDCSFENNFAATHGGHLATDTDSTSVEISRTKFLQTESSKNYNGVSFAALSFISTESAGPLLLHSTLLNMSLSGVGRHTVLRVSKGGRVAFMDTPLFCPQGSSLDLLNFTNKITIENGTSQCTIVVTVLQFDCKACVAGYYSLQRGRSNGTDVVSGFQCLPCPYGADCSNNIRAEANFWGYQVRDDPPALNFTNCPVNYCKQPSSQRTQYNGCQGNRTGTLCGECKPGYTETLLSPVCRQAATCNDTWLWGVAFLFFLTMALYLITKPPLVWFLLHQILWFRKLRDQPDVTTRRRDSGYLKIIFYFYQIANILMVSNSSSALATNFIVQPVLGLFNFQLRVSAHGLLCPFPGLTTATKELLFATQVFAVLCSVFLWYIIHSVFCAIRKRQSPSLGPYLGAVMETLLLGYAVLAKASLKLLKCVTIDTESRLFVAAEVTCYQWWQYLLIGFVCVNVVPFVVLLACGSWWLHKGTISAKHLLIGCILPLPFLIYRLIGFLCGSVRDSRDPSEWKASIERVLYSPFKSPDSTPPGAVYWESVLIGRRLILIILYVSISNPFTRQLFLTLVCVVILLHHSLVRPFQNSKANTTETMSLLCLVTIAILNILRAGFLALGQVPQGPFRSLLEVFDWVQVSLLAVLPVVFLFSLLGFVLSQVIRLFYVIGSIVCCYGYGRREQSPLLDVTGPNKTDICSDNH